jgi:4'-phosphopantetheinyl transferase
MDRAHLSTVWQPRPAQANLAPGEAHVWRFSLDPGDAELARLAQLLAVDERARAERFHFAKNRRQYTVGRGVLRTILGWYLGQPAETLSFNYTVHGKPHLPTQTGPDRLCFNLSHSEEMALLALTRGCEVGVDIEWIDAERAHEDIAERFFSPAERTALRQVAPSQRAAAFFACWTRKEAYIKGRGLGLALPLDSFDVSLAPAEPAALLATRPDADDARRWSLQQLEPGPGYAGAVAVESCSWRLWCGEWSPARAGASG